MLQLSIQLSLLSNRSRSFPEQREIKHKKVLFVLIFNPLIFFYLTPFDQLKHKVIFLTCF